MGSDGGPVCGPVCGPVRTTDQGLLVDIRLQPGARHNRVDGLAVLDDGARALKVRVSAPPADGRANAALLALLATTWKLPKSSLSLAAGPATAAMHQRSAAWLADLPPARGATGE